MKIWWNTKAWPWLQKNWKWILFPVGLLVIAGRVFAGRSTTVVGSELTGAANAEVKANEKASNKLARALAKRNREIAEKKAQHAEVVQEQVDAQKAEAKELVEDPAALNDFLKDVGKKQRQ